MSFAYFFLKHIYSQSLYHAGAITHNQHEQQQKRLLYQCA